MNLQVLTLRERAALAVALNREFPNGLRCTSETMQFFTEAQIAVALGCIEFEKLKERIND